MSETTGRSFTRGSKARRRTKTAEHGISVGNFSEIRWKMKQLHGTTDQSPVTPFPFWSCRIRWDRVMHGATTTTTALRTLSIGAEWTGYPEVVRSHRSPNVCTLRCSWRAREAYRRLVSGGKRKIHDSRGFNAVRRQGDNGYRVPGRWIFHQSFLAFRAAFYFAVFVSADASPIPFNWLRAADTGNGVITAFPAENSREIIISLTELKCHGGDSCE